MIYTIHDSHYKKVAYANPSGGYASAKAAVNVILGGLPDDFVYFVVLNEAPIPVAVVYGGVAYWPREAESREVSTANW